MAGSIFGIGLSGLAAAQAGLLTAGHNISNVNTPNYSRQEVLLGSRPPLYSGSGFIGRGVNVETIRRVYDTFLVAQARQAQADASQLDAYQAQLGKLDNLLGNSTSGLAPIVDQFFASINSASANPSDGAARQALLASAQGLVNRFHLLDERLTETRSSLNQQITSTVASVNATAAEIASINQKIAASSAGSGGLLPPNDLLDQRDALLASLNQHIGAVAVTQTDGTLNVFLTNGQALVVAQNAFKLAAVTDPVNPQDIEVGLQTGSSVLRFSAADLTGGSLSGLLAARDNVLGGAQSALGRIAAVLAKSVNDQHLLGVDLKGAPGQAFFVAPVPQVQSTLTNAGTAVVSAALTDASALTASDYMLRYDGANYTLTRLSDNAVSTFATLPQSVDGLSITLGAGAPAAGDSFFIQPTRFAARDIGVAVSDPARLALAGPILTGAPTTNSGSGRISFGSVTAAYLGAPLAGTVALTFNSVAGTLTGFPSTQPVTVTVGTTSTTYPAGSPVPYTSDATIEFGGIRFSISGAPANGDAFNVAPNLTGAGDNRNALALGALATQNLVAGGTATLQGAYGQLVGQIGAVTHQAQIESDAQAHLLAQAQQAQQEVSGVNLDEEAANLQRYQQAYQASSKVLAIAASLFESILALGGR